MQHRKTLSGLVVAPLLAAAIAAPAMAQPAVEPGSAAHIETKQDLRGEAAADTSRAPETPAGVPTWPVNPKPIAPPVVQSVATGGDGGDVEWPVAALAMAGTLLLGGGMGVVATRRRIGHTQAAG
jgi:hypothetical protein